MSTTYYLSSTTSDLTGPTENQAPDSNRYILASTGTLASVTLNLATTGTGQQTDWFFTQSGVPGTAGGVQTSADYTVEINVTSGSTVTDMAVKVARINSSGTVQAESAFTANQLASPTGVKTFNITGANLGTFASGDRVRLGLRSTIPTGGGSMGQNITLGLNTTDSEFIAPWDFINDVRVSFPTPATSPTAGTDFQEFRALVRKKVNDANNPLVRLELWESGALKSTVLADTAVTSNAGQVVSGLWDASTLTTASGANVECRVRGTQVGGNQLEVGAIEWNKYPQDVAAAQSLLLPTDTVQRILMRR